MKDTVFFRQAELLLRILPLIHKEEVFALKGGTAIGNLRKEGEVMSVYTFADRDPPKGAASRKTTRETTENFFLIFRPQRSDGVKRTPTSNLSPSIPGGSGGRGLDFLMARRADSSR